MSAPNLKKNYFFNLAYQILITIIPIVTTPYLSRVLRPEGIGMNSYASSMVSYFTLFAALGTSTYAQRKIARFQTDIQKRSEVFAEVFGIRFIMSSILLVAYIMYCIFMAKEYFAISVIYAFMIVNVALDITWLFQGMEEFQSIVLRNTIVRVINVVFIFVFVKNENDVLLYAGSYVLTNVLGSMLMWSRARKLIILKTRTNVFQNIKEIIELFIPTIAVQIYTILDRTMIGWFSETSAENGYYSQTENMIKLCLMIITSLGTVMLPRISKLFSEHKNEEIKEYIYKSYRYIWLLSLPLMVGMMSIATTFVPVFFGDGYEKSIVLMYILSPIIVLISLSTVSGNQYLLATNRQRQYSISLVAGSIVNVIVNLLLIPQVYSVGAAVGTLCAESVVTTMQIVFIKNDGMIRVGHVFRMSIWYWIASGIMGGVVFGLSRLMQNSVISLVIQIVVGVIVYFSILLIKKDDMCISVLNSVIKRFCKKGIKNGTRNSV